ncbi:MAG: hypothetical protein EON95_09865 [Caulobacteraceae bacterium]|nr:MAG: hypothetical protein EON95_09865 [Caulobacteraceae bacterium]
MTFERPVKPPLRTFAVIAAALLAVAAAPLIALAGLPDASAFAEDGNETLRAAGYAFAIWGLIYALLVAYGVWQLVRQTPETAVLRAVAWPSVVAMTGCAAWLLAAGLDLKALSVAIIAGSAAAVITGLLRARPHRGEVGPGTRFFIFWPLGLLAGWLTIASFINLITVLTAWGVITPDLARPAALLGILGVLLVGGAVVWRLRHLAYGLPIVWGLIAVWAAEHVAKPQVGQSALVAAGVMLLVSLAAGRKRQA